MRLIWCLTCWLFCCSFYPTRDKLKEYYRLIYQAEDHLCQGDYNVAYDHYRAAFKKRIPFYADLRNAFKTSLLSKDAAKIGHIWMIIKKQPDLVHELKSNDRLLDLCPKRIKREITGYSQQRAKTPLETILDSIRAVDQRARKECSNNLKAECKERFFRTDSANIKFITSLLSQTAYTEAVQGEQSLQTCFLVAWHARRWGFKDLDTVLYAYIRKGWIKPGILAQLNQYRSDIDSVNKKHLNDQLYLGYEATSISINHHLIEMNQSDSMIKAINAARKNYYLGLVERDIDKKALILQNPLFKGCAADFNVELFQQGMSEQEFKQFLNDLTQKGVVKKLWF